MKSVGVGEGYERVSSKRILAIRNLGVAVCTLAQFYAGWSGPLGPPVHIVLIKPGKQEPKL